jgi:hypothetical protein
VIVPLASAAALMFACGPWGIASQHDEDGGVPRARVESDAPIASALNVRVGDGVELELTVLNNTKRAVEFKFADGRTHDFVILDGANREVWRWSNGRLFTSAMQTRFVRSGRSATYHTHWHPESEHGTYVAVAMLHASNHPVSARVPFTLP